MMTSSSSNDVQRLSCHLGIDVGTQGLTALLATDEAVASTDATANTSSKSFRMKVLAIGEASYGFVPGLAKDCYEQNPQDWEDALLKALKQIQTKLVEKKLSVTVRALCVTGQMHGCVMLDCNGNALGTARLWCDARNQSEADELGKLFGERIPKRMTVARYLWSLRQEPFKTNDCVGLTTPAGYLAHRLTMTRASHQMIYNRNGATKSSLDLVLGIGEASGMFPIENGDYRNDLIQAFDDHVRKLFPNRSPNQLPSLRTLLPTVRLAGDGRKSSGEGPLLLNPTLFAKPHGDQSQWSLYEVKDLFETHEGIIEAPLVAPSEGDQPAALVASLVGRHGTISCSFGTSVVANMIGKQVEENKSESIPSSSSSSQVHTFDKFCAVNGQPISMVWLRNGTTFLNEMVDSNGGDFEDLLRQALEAPTDCGGLLALPFIDDEPSMGVTRGGTEMILGPSASKRVAGNVVKASLVSVMFNLYLGCQKVEALEARSNDTNSIDDTSSSPKEIVLTGGLAKTPATGQILANIFDRPVRLLEAADEGGAWGAALLAKYCYDCGCRNSIEEELPPHPDDWLAFLDTIEVQEQRTFSPQKADVGVYRSMLEKYKTLLKLQPQLDKIVNGYD